MRRPLLPYAAVAVLVVVASSAALFATVRPAADRAANATSAPRPTASRAAPELSRTGRVTYWRDRRLWVSNLDGSLRYPIASVDDVRRVTLTRWSTDGGSVAYVDNGTSLVVIPTQGDGIVVTLPRQLAGIGFQIKDIRWSLDSTHIAATVLRPTDGRSDAYVVDLGAAQPAWTRVTTMEDVFVADWISSSELLGYTAGGAVVVLKAQENGAVRLLVGMVGVSPIVGGDGRIHFLAGRVPFSRDPSFPFQTAMRASAWSIAADGSDARQETSWDINDIRLETRLPDGRYLVHRGASDALGMVTSDVALLPSSAGVVERIRVAADGRTAYGFALDKIVRIDLSKFEVTSNAAASGAMTVFLDTGGDADVWSPSQVSVARGSGSPATSAPTGRYAFALGGHVWQTQRGVATLFIAGGSPRRTFVPAPKWAAGGDHLLVVGPASPSVGTLLRASVVDRAGSVTPLAQSLGTGRSFAWSPSGSEVAIAVDRRGQTATGAPDLEIRFFDPSGRATRPAIPGTEVAWSAAGLYVLANVTGDPGQALERVEGDAPPRTLLTRSALADRAGVTGTAGRSVTLTGLDTSANGAFASVRFQTVDPQPRTWLAIVGGDGAVIQLMRQDDLADVAWSPTASDLGYTIGVRAENEHAYIVTPDGTRVASKEGRFAGWTADGKSYLIARGGSLYGYPVAGGEGVRLGPASAPVSAAP